MQFTPDCSEVATRLWRPLHHQTLSTREKVGLKAHLLICPDCRHYKKTFEWVLEILAQNPEAPALSAAYKMPIATKARLKTTIAENTGCDEGVTVNVPHE